MAYVEIYDEVPLERAPYEAIAQMGAGGASPRGSTYWRRVQSCPREHLLANVLGWEKVVRADALDTGLLWHGCLESLYNGKKDEQRGRPHALTPEQEAFDFLQRFRDHQGWGGFYDTCSTMLDAYCTRWQHADNEWEIVAVEFTCGWTRETAPEVYRRLGFEETTRFDLIVVDHSLTPVTRIIESKSSHALDPQTIFAYSMDDQVLGQIYLGRYWVPWRELGYPPFLGSLVNVCTKAKSPKCERLPIQPSDLALAAWADHKRYWQWQSEQYPALGYPQNYVNCTRRFGRCQFYELCRGLPQEDALHLIRRDRDADLPVNYVKRESRFDVAEAL